MTERERLAEAALTHVPFEGMNEGALRAGAEDLGIDPALVPVLFPRGGADLAADYHRAGDAELARWLADTPPEGRFRDRIAAAVMKRLEMADRELVRAGASTLALPANAGLGARLTWETADLIWRGLGDRSDDVNWYSKRAILSAVIGATVLFWLGDDSSGHAETRDFLDRRLDGVMRFEGLKAKIRKLPGAARLTELATGWIRAPETRDDLPGRSAR